MGDQIKSNKQKKCYIYTRVSTEMQIEGYSLDAQKECLRKEAKHRNMIIVDEYSDEGKSGKNMCQWGWFSLTHFLIEDESYVTDFNGI